MIRKRARLLCRILIPAVCLMCLTGCHDRRELNTLGIVLGVAIDKGEKEGETKLTFEVSNPSGDGAPKSKKKNGNETGGSRPEYINATATGRNVNHVIREMQHKISRRLYMPHARLIVVGEDLAKDGVRDCLDFFARAPEARLTLYFLVARGKAGDVLKIEPEFENVPGEELTMLLLDQKITSHAPIVTVFEMLRKMTSGTTCAVAPIVRIEEEENGDTKRLNVSGCAVFKGSQMIGELDEPQTRGMLIIANKAKTGVLLADIEDATATIEIRQINSRVTPELYTDGSAVIKIKVDAMVGLGDQSGTFNITDVENQYRMNEAAELAIREEIQGAVDKARELNADIFGFGEKLRGKYPKQWEEMENKWDQLYRNVGVEITVQAKAEATGRVTQPLIPAPA